MALACLVWKATCMYFQPEPSSLSYLCGHHHAVFFCHMCTTYYTNFIVNAPIYHKLIKLISELNEALSLFSWEPALTETELC